MIVTKVSGRRGFEWTCNRQGGCPHFEKCSMENGCLTMAKCNLRWWSDNGSMCLLLQENIGGEWVTVPSIYGNVDKKPNYKEFVDWVDNWFKKSIKPSPTEVIDNIAKFLEEAREKINALRAMERDQ